MFYTLATVGADKLWDLLNSEPFVPALGALSGNQAMQMVRAGLKAVYCSGWQVISLLLKFPGSLSTFLRSVPGSIVFIYSHSQPTGRFVHNPRP